MSRHGRGTSTPCSRSGVSAHPGVADRLHRAFRRGVRDGQDDGRRSARRRPRSRSLRREPRERGRQVHRRNREEPRTDPRGGARCERRAAVRRGRRAARQALRGQGRADRYANIEVAHLLQLLDAFEGILVLTTNLRANLDESFTRRLDALVDFPVPDANERLHLWTRALGGAVPLVSTSICRSARRRSASPVATSARSR